jgi:hypothetical protein
VETVNIKYKQMNAPLFLTGTSNDQWPCIRNIAQTFAKKIDCANIVTIGLNSSNDIDFDAQIVEKVGGYWHIITQNSSQTKFISDLILTSREENSYLSKKFIDTDLIKTYEVVEGQEYSNILSKIENIDIVKLDSEEAMQTRLALFQILDRGFRPAFIFIRWRCSPDTHVPTQLVAGHLHCSGYILVGLHEDKYIYYFNRDCIYDYAAFTEPTICNPIMNEIIKQIAIHDQSESKIEKQNR